jgi:dipeptidyl aminopeptidase/acylaminoacyl peptidase
MKQFFLVAILAASELYAQKAVIQPGDIANLKRVEAPHISPDGRWIAYTVDVPVAAEKHRSAHIWLVPSDHSAAARPFAYSGESESAPDFSPDGTHIAFLSDRPNPLAEPDASPFRFAVAPGAVPKDVAPDPKYAKELAESKAKGEQLWWISLSGGEAEPLTDLPGGIRTFKWSHDGKYIAFIRTDTETPEERERKAAKNDQNLIDRDYHYDRLWIYDLATRQARLLTSESLNIDSIDWSPDGASIIARVSPTPRLDDYWRVSKVVLFDTRSGSIQRTIEEHSGYASPSFSHDGTRIAYSRFTPRQITDVHLIRTLADGKEIRLEDKLPGTVSQMLWTGPGSHLLVSEYLGAHRQELEVDAVAFTVAPLAGDTLTSEDFQASVNGSTLAFLGESPEVPAEVFSWSNGKAQALTSTNPQVAQWSIGRNARSHGRMPPTTRPSMALSCCHPGTSRANGTRRSCMCMVARKGRGPQASMATGTTTPPCSRRTGTLCFCRTLAAPMGKAPSLPKRTIRIGVAAISRTSWQESTNS